MPRIAVEGNLHNVQKALKNSGFDVITLESSQELANCDCCVISGVDQNMMGVETTTSNIPVISAEGMNEQQIVDKVRSRTQRR